MYKTMIINTITSREDRATITAIIGVSSEIKRTKHVIIIVCNGGLKSAAQGNTQMRKKGSSKCLCRWLGMGRERGREGGAGGREGEKGGAEREREKRTPFTASPGLLGEEGGTVG